MGTRINELWNAKMPHTCERELRLRYRFDFLYIWRNACNAAFVLMRLYTPPRQSRNSIGRALFIFFHLPLHRDSVDILYIFVYTS